MWFLLRNGRDVADIEKALRMKFQINFYTVYSKCDIKLGDSFMNSSENVSLNCVEINFQFKQLSF